MSANHKYEVCVSPQEWEFSQGPKTTKNPNGEGFNFISTLQYPFQTRDEHFIRYMFISGVGIWWLNVYYKKMFIYSYDFFVSMQFQCSLMKSIHSVFISAQAFREPPSIHIPGKLPSKSAQIHENYATKDGGHDCHGDVSDPTRAHTRVAHRDFLSDGDGRILGRNSDCFYDFLNSLC